MAIVGVYAFEEIDDSLPYVPLAGRRVLDAVGRKLSLEGWSTLAADDRRRIVSAGTRPSVDHSVLPIIDGVTRAPARLPPEPEPDAERVAPALVLALGPSRPLDDARWRALGALDRYALSKYLAKTDKLARAYDEIVGAPKAAEGPAGLTHLDGHGAARMVDVSAKPETARAARATACLRTTRAVIDAVAAGATSKGDVLAAARIAGIFAAKKTSDLLPLCHPVRTTHVSIDFELDAQREEIRVGATVEAIDRTGVEMEAMTAAAVASLTLYDMIKGIDRWASIEAVRLQAKHGGRSGEVKRPGERS